MKTQELIDRLQLQPHPEGGYYKETYRSRHKTGLNGNARSVCTAIYYLLENDDKSSFHRIKSDELWFFHSGTALEIISIVDGKVRTSLLGTDASRDESFQLIVPAHTWFAARVKGGKGYALVSCTVSPGFDFADFEIAKRENLIELHPDLHETIVEFTKD